MGILAHLKRVHLHKKRPVHRWAVLASIPLFGVVAAFGTVPDSADLRDFQKVVVEPLAFDPAPAADEHPAFISEERIQRGDTFSALLSRLGVQDEEAFAQIRQHKETQVLFRQLRPGKIVTARTDENGELLALSFPLNGPADDVLHIEKQSGKLQVTEEVQSLKPQLVMKSGEIRTSLFAATDQVGMPDSIATQMAEIFGGDIDFHRDLRKGDRFGVVYEMLYHKGQPARAGRILAAEFVNAGKTFRALWFSSKEGQGYYTADGKNIRKAFLRSPLEFSRVTSGFTTGRFHPILQKWRAHKGVDYGAPTGTRVKATGDGIIDFVGKQSGYGNLIVIRHQGGHFATYYGHLNGFASGLHKGQRVSQGDVIGYVGQTGLATGPHLHYEFRIDGIHQNPLALTLPSAPPLASARLEEFKQAAEPLVFRLEQIRGMTLAQID